MNSTPHSEETRELLNSLESRPVNPDLSTVKAATQRFQVPNETAIVQVVGTNGKGSVVHYLETILSNRGTEVQSYSSPHFRHPRERFHVCGSSISIDRFRDVFGNVEEKTAGNCSPFEIMFLMSLEIASQDSPDVLILEAGMGGRWDATSAVQADLTVLTGVEEEHTKFLGDTRNEILREQIAQIPDESVLITIPFENPLRREIQTAVKERRITLSRIGRMETPRDTMKLLASSAAELLTGRDRTDLYSALGSVAPPPGRQEYLAGLNRRWILDVAHTPGAIKALSERIDPAESERSMFVLFSCLKNKRVTEMLDLLSRDIPASLFLLAEAPSSRRMNVSELKNQRPSPKMKVVSMESVETKEHVLETSSENDLIVVTGSFSIVDLVRHKWLDLDLP